MYNSSLPKYFFASDFAVKKRFSSSDSFSTIFIPFPPPPPAALIKTGKPIFAQIFFASSKDLTPPSDPSIIGNPYFFAIFFASILSPICLINSALGPMNLIPCF